MKKVLTNLGLLLTGALFYSISTTAQRPLQTISTEIACELPLPVAGEPLFILPDRRPSPATASLRSGGIMVNFVNGGAGCLTWTPQAQAAVQYAADLWNANLPHAFTITVGANLNGFGVGSGGSGYITLSNAPGIGDVTFYPDALAEEITGQDVGTPELSLTINGCFGDWYYGLDGNPPANKVDFVSVALHEIGHGLGFAGLKSYSGMVGTYGSSGKRDIYAYQLQTDDGTSLINIPNATTSVGTLFTGGSLSGGAGGLFDKNSGNKMYTPSSFSSGSSYSHYDLATNSGQLMTEAISYGQAIHSPGDARQLLVAMGWGTGDASLPVRWTDFQVAGDPLGVRLYWETATEVQNKGFHIERSGNGIAWETIAFVPGQGDANTTQTYQFLDAFPLYGNNYYRLRQEDWDGQYGYSSVRVYMRLLPEETIVVYPIPAQDHLTVFIPDLQDPIAYHIFDPLGRPCRQGILRGTQESLAVGDLTPGTYILRLADGRQRVLSVVR